MLQLLLALSLAAINFLILQPVAAQIPTPPSPPDKTERLIIKFKPLTPQFIRNRILTDLSTEASAKVDNLLLKHTIVTHPPTEQLYQIRNRLSRNPFIDYVEPDYQAQAFTIPNDPYFQDQWALETIQAPDAWDITTGSNQVNIAVLDTGVNQNHPDLQGKITQSANFTYETDGDHNGHGTHVAGIASANTDNSTGIAGVSWHSQIIDVKVLDRRGRGYYSWLANGLVWATDHGADVINLSLGGSSPSRTLENAIQYAEEQGITLVAAAGNDNSNRPTYPAYYPEVISIAATDNYNQKASFSNFGSWVDLTAPGVSILSTTQNDYAYYSGTSQATPHVSGVAALLLSYHPGWSNSQIRDKLISSANPVTGTGQYWQSGLLNACAALDCNSTFPPPTPSPVPTGTGTPTPTPTPNPTLTPAPTPLPPTPTNTPSPTPTPSPASIPTPTPQPNLPWWCRYLPQHRYCQG